MKTLNPQPPNPKPLIKPETLKALLVPGSNSHGMVQKKASGKPDGKNKNSSGKNLGTRRRSAGIT